MTIKLSLVSLSFESSTSEPIDSTIPFRGVKSLAGKESILISGDVIFKNSIGRTDLPGGDFTTLITSIKNNILPLSDKTQIFCGHGLNTNLEYERENNPFINQL